MRDAYYAGLMDGEASFCIERGGAKNTPKPTIDLKMTCERTVRGISAHFGVGNVMHRPSTHEGWKDQWRWRATDRGARIVVARVLPWLITKRPLADLFIEHWVERGLWPPLDP